MVDYADHSLRIKVPMVDSPCPKDDLSLVEWALSGEYDADKPVRRETLLYEQLD